MSPDRASNKSREGFSPKDEWELGKLQVRTLVDSGALTFLEELKSTLDLNPALSKAIIPVGEFYTGYGRNRYDLPLIPHALKVENHIGKLLYVAKSKEVSRISTLERDPVLQQFRIETHKFPGNYYATVEFWYNPREDSFALPNDDVVYPLSIIRPPSRRSAYVLYDILMARCWSPRQVELTIKTSSEHYNREVIGKSLAETSWRQEGVLRQVFMELYKRKPAKALDERI